MNFDEWYEWWVKQASNLRPLSQYEGMKIAYEAGLQNAAQQGEQPTLQECKYCKRVHDSRVACPEYAAKSQGEQAGDLKTCGICGVVSNNPCPHHAEQD